MPLRLIECMQENSSLSGFRDYFNKIGTLMGSFCQKVKPCHFVIYGPERTQKHSISAWCSYSISGKKMSNSILLWILYRFFSVLCLLCLCARLFICALWLPAGKGLTSWLSFVVSKASFICTIYTPVQIYTRGVNLHLGYILVM